MRTQTWVLLAILGAVAGLFFWQRSKAGQSAMNAAVDAAAAVVVPAEPKKKKKKKKKKSGGLLGKVKDSVGGVAKGAGGLAVGALKKNNEMAMNFAAKKIGA
jgi:hypothetical protein